MLNRRQKAFADYYIQFGNAEQAAIKAGYSQAYARAQSYKLLENVGIREYIDELIEKADEQRVAKSKEVLETLTRILRRQEKEVVVVKCKRRRSYFDSAGKKVVEENEEPMQVEIPTAVRDVNKAAEMLAKRYGLLVDKVSVQDDSEILVKVEYEDNPESEQNI